MMHVRCITALYVSPFLNVGGTLACFQSLCISSYSSDFENKLMLKLVQLVHLILLLLSGLHAVCRFRLHNSFHISADDMFILYNL